MAQQRACLPLWLVETQWCGDHLVSCCCITAIVACCLLSKINNTVAFSFAPVSPSFILSLLEQWLTLNSSQLILHQVGSTTWPLTVFVVFSYAWGRRVVEWLRFQQGLWDILLLCFGVCDSFSPKISYTHRLIKDHHWLQPESSPFRVNTTEHYKLHKGQIYCQAVELNCQYMDNSVYAWSLPKHLTNDTMKLLKIYISAHLLKKERIVK